VARQVAIAQDHRGSLLPFSFHYTRSGFIAKMNYWERRLPAGRASRASMSVTPTTMTATVSRLEAGAPSRYGA